MYNFIVPFKRTLDYSISWKGLENEALYETFEIKQDVIFIEKLLKPFIKTPNSGLQRYIVP